MSNVSHVSTVDRGLKMKIKRTKVGPASSKADPKHEVVKSDGTGGSAQSAGAQGSGVHAVNGLPASGNSATGMSTPSKTGGTGASDPSNKDKASPKVKTPFGKKDKGKDKGASTPTTKLSTDSGTGLANGSTATNSGSTASSGTSGSASSSGAGTVCNGGLDGLFPQVSMEPRVAVEAVSMRREVARPVLDPYEFNAKVEDGIGLPPKKLKTESKLESAASPAHTAQHQDASTETCSVGVVTEPECLGPCEPGTSVTLEGIVWQETENGVLVINVTWRGKTYVGTLLDATKHDWAPPRPNCESPVSDFETRLPKGRGKRGRANAGTPVSDRSLTEGRKLRKGRRGSNANFQAPPSPARSETSSMGGKRKARPTEDNDKDKGSSGSSNKRSRSCSRGGASGTESPTPSVIECPEPNCNKKYKHINGLRYHQTHAHHHPLPVPDTDKEEEEDMDTDSKDSKKDSASEGKDSKKEHLSERAERMKAKEQRQREKEREKSLEKDCSALEDNIPLKFVAGRVGGQASDRTKGDVSVSLTKASDTARVDLSAISTSLSAASLSSSSVNSSPLSASTSVTTKKKDGGPSMSVGMSVSKTSPSGQVYQISGVVGGLQAMSSSNTVQAPVVTPAIAVTASSATSTAPIPITVASMGTLDGKDGKPVDKAKTGKVMARPIVPAPNPQMMGLSGGVPSTQGSLVPPPGHSQASPSLKMIQPKPTIMGEYSGVNPALVDLKEKRSKSKKKKEKDGPQSGAGQPGGVSPLSKPSGKDDQGKPGDRPAVIKSVASSPMSRPPQDLTPRKDGIPSIEVSKPADSPRTPVTAGGPLSSTVTPQTGLKSQDQLRSVQPPGLLKVNSPLHVNASERKTPINDDVQSPAYSDISDANDSSSPQQQESPKKDSEVASKKDDGNSGPVPPAEASTPAFSMYYRYGGPSPFLSPNVTTPHASPNSTKPGPQKKEDGSRSDGAGPTDEARKNAGDRPEDKDGAAAKGPPGAKPGMAPGGPLPADGHGATPATSSQQQQQQQQQIQEYQQKWLQHVYSQIRLLPQQAQYQYLAAYGMLDPYHQMHFVNQQDPNYRQMVERASQEQKKQQEQGGAVKKPESDSDKKQPGSRPPSNQGPSASDAGPSGTLKPPQSIYGQAGPAPERMYEGKPPGEGSDDLREQALREKQNENHQILKENIELKSQMERGRQEEARRMQMYHQQKLYEQQRSAEKRKLEMQGKPPELTSSAKPPGVDPSRMGLPPGGIKTETDIKKEPMDRIKDMASRPPDNKSVDDKKLGDKGRPGPADTANKPPASSTVLTSTAMSASSTAPSNPPTVPPGQYAPYYTGVYPHYPPHLQMDPNHPMYRSMNPHVIGYASAPPGPYLHPSQLAAYRMAPPVDGEKEGSKAEGKPQGPPTSEESGKAGEFYPPVHKIHELQEKGKAPAGSASPSPGVKSSEGSTPPTNISALADKQREYSKSPPTQRHLHTHHHTHVLSHGFPVPFPHDPYAAVPAAAAMFAAPPPHGPPAPAPATSIQPPFSK